MNAPNDDYGLCLADESDIRHERPTRQDLIEVLYCAGDELALAAEIAERLQLPGTAGRLKELAEQITSDAKQFAARGNPDADL